MIIISRNDKYNIADHQEIWPNRYAYHLLRNKGYLTGPLIYICRRQVPFLQLVMDVSSRVNLCHPRQRHHPRLPRNKVASSFVLVTLAIFIYTGTRMWIRAHLAKNLAALCTTLLMDKENWRIWWLLPAWKGKFFFPETFRMSSY